MKIAQKLFLAVGVFLTVALVGLGGYSAITTKSFLTQAAHDKIHTETQKVLVQIEEIVGTTTTDLQVVSAHKAFEDYLTFVDFGDNDGMSKEIDNIEGFLARVYKAKPHYAIFQLYGGNQPALQLINGERKEKFVTFDHAMGMALLKASIEKTGTRVVHRAALQNNNIGIESLQALGTGTKIEGVLRTYQDISETLKRLVASMAKRDIQLAIYDAERHLITASDQIKRFAGSLPQDKPLPGWVTETGKIPGLNWSVMAGLEEKKAFRVVHGMVLGTATAITLTLISAAIFLGFITRWIVVKPLTRVSDGLWRIARGEAAVTTQLDINTNDEVGNLAKAFNEIVTAIHRALLKVITTTESLSGQTSKLLKVATQFSDGALQQRDSVNRLSASMTEAAASAGSVAEVTSKAATAANHAKSEGYAISATIQNSLAVFTYLADEVSQETDVINQLAKDSEGINKILQSIRGIAEKTNLLALNAAIEAARAGEHGRGFAIVADEVRQLAGRTQGATVEIEAVTKKILLQARNAAQTMDTTRESAEKSRRSAETTEASVKMIIQGIEQITELNTQVAAATEEQGIVAQEVNGHLSAIAQVATEAAEGAEEMRKATDSLVNLSAELTKAVGQFKF